MGCVVMAVRAFLSTENTSDPLSAELIDRLVAAGFEVTTSPLNPALGADPRWLDWYGDGCLKAIATTDVFVAVVTDGYDCSTWMGFEADRAGWLHRNRGRPDLYLLKTGDEPLPLGFRRYEEAATRLPVDLDEVEVLLQGKGARRGHGGP
ncbi:MAG: toll/interleukin-1 receptor domain-containing protein [Polyangiaceae bacterium]|nr:toll/interleukin-1 receptor domain-containing protein [Polyangiaceae bacterium]